MNNLAPTLSLIDDNLSIEELASLSLSDLKESWYLLEEPVAPNYPIELIYENPLTFLLSCVGIVLIVVASVLLATKDPIENRFLTAVQAAAVSIFGLVFILFMLIAVGSIQNNSHSNKVKEYNISKGFIQELYKNKFITEEIKSKYDFESQLKGVEVKYLNPKDLKIAEVTGVYDDLDSGVSYDLRFVVDEDQNATLMVNGDVTKDFIESLKK